MSRPAIRLGTADPHLSRWRWAPGRLLTNPATPARVPRQQLSMPFVTSTLDCLEELAFLRAYRCEEAQGYYFSRSVPPQQFAMLLRSGITESSVVA